MYANARLLFLQLVLTQIIDDLLDFKGDHRKLGKPAHGDLKLGLVTAPVFFALQEDETLRPRVLRRFEAAGDIEAVSKSMFTGR